MGTCSGPKLPHFCDPQVDSSVQKSQSCQRQDASDQKYGPMKVILNIVFVIPKNSNFVLEFPSEKIYGEIRPKWTFLPQNAKSGPANFNVLKIKGVSIVGGIFSTYKYGKTRQKRQTFSAVFFLVSPYLLALKIWCNAECVSIYAL
jgi:hypothetical protein